MSIWAEFRESPLKFGVGVFLVAASIYIFLGDISFKASYDDVKVEVSTQEKK